jgi:energy-coupling factor transport system permease protein
MHRIRLDFPGSSWVHRLHPAAKVIVWVFGTAFAAILPWQIDLVFFVALVATLSSTRIPFSHYRLTLLLSVPVAIVSPILLVLIPEISMHEVLFTVALPSLSLAGGVSVGLHPVPIFYEAVSLGIYRDLLYTNTLILTILTLSTTSLSDLADAPTYLGAPHVVGFVIASTLRYIPVVANSILTLYDVQESRGVDFFTQNPVSNFRRRGEVLIPVLIYQLSRANRMSNAIESRGFQIKQSPTLYALRTLSFSERILMYATIAVTLGFFLIRIYTTLVPGDYPLGY